MTDTPVEYHRSRYDAPRQKGFMGVSVGIWLITLAVVTVLFAIMIFYLQKTRFELKLQEYSDEAVEVEIVQPIPPPPPPDTPPPPKLQVRPPVINTSAPPPPITLPIEPTPKEDRVEYTGPPVIVPGPPPPPAPPAPVRPPVITNPSWASQPRPTYPDRALERGLSGSADLSCTVNPNGSVSGCSVVSETPAGAGFGRAALAAARSARLSPRSVDGVATGGTVRFTVRFNLPD